MSSELGKYGSTSVVQASSISFTFEVSDHLVVHTGPGGVGDGCRSVLVGGWVDGW